MAKLQLVIDFAGQITELTPDERLTFGRSADLSIDTNPYLHRRLGRFRWSSGNWWIDNIGTSIMLEITDRGSTSRLSVAPGTSLPLGFVDSVMRFQAGAARYELGLRVSGRFPITIVHDGPVDSLSAIETVTATVVSLNREQFRLLVALAEPRLLDLAATPVLPTNREAADRLGWSISKFNRKLDNLCGKFARLGVPGLKGDLSGMATGRRENLVGHVIRVGIISPDDLSLLDEG